PPFNASQGLPQPSISNQPQFHFSTPIEDPKLTQNVIQQSLNTPFSITLQEFYSTSSEARKFVKDQLTMRCIPIGQTAAMSAFEEATEEDNVFSFLQQSPTTLPRSLIIANQVKDLWTIPLELGGSVTVEAILDEGSQITAIQRDVWERLGLPLLSNQTMVMESANSSKEATLGLLHNLPAHIGRSTLYLQVQVVENASYEMLLG
ncbi:hypothetical protein P691DRAFT_815582, partial [Macrolepiota fuliginosa MF-IS2]